MREYYCPGCGVQLEVETLPVGYPAVFEFLPDIDAFYRDWLDRPLESEKEFKYPTYDLTQKWAKEGKERKLLRASIVIHNQCRDSRFQTS